MSESDIEDDELDKEEILNNFIAYLGIIKEEEESFNSNAHTDENQENELEEEKSDLTMITSLIEDIILRKEENQALITRRKLAEKNLSSGTRLRSGEI